MTSRSGYGRDPYIPDPTDSLHPDMGLTLTADTGPLGRFLRGRFDPSLAQVLFRTVTAALAEESPFSSHLCSPEEIHTAEDGEMTGWFKATDAKELPQGTMKGIDVGGAKVLLVHGASGIRAFEDRCGHMSAPMSIGTFKGGVIKCALHSAVFDGETGAVRVQPQMHSPTARLPPEMMEAMAQMGQIMAQIRCETLRPYPVAVENGDVMVYV